MMKPEHGKGSHGQKHKLMLNTLNIVPGSGAFHDS